ncbi:uncharacterized protein BJ171DRAFT_44468 [Polychytrium aggregatum]|uniref:uncharacterized protein n=1 Tax=Polychytrium aggregatum TaxID=110093 RepID=UPI0022FE7C19|nr:uncharacterized protein BJ171DRAFT_44468 [Polychytrium aggregatum]KAI9206254.1 hypothetical protein BJ171DRAFT_44468 [Polychytrium aggregatum]
MDPTLAGTVQHVMNRHSPSKFLQVSLHCSQLFPSPCLRCSVASTVCSNLTLASVSFFLTTYCAEWTHSSEWPFFVSQSIPGECTPIEFITAFPIQIAISTTSARIRIQHLVLPDDSQIGLSGRFPFASSCHFIRSCHVPTNARSFQHSPFTADRDCNGFVLVRVRCSLPERRLDSHTIVWVVCNRSQFHVSLPMRIADSLATISFVSAPVWFVECMRCVLAVIFTQNVTLYGLRPHKIPMPCLR